MVEISEVPEKSDSRVTEAYLEPITLMMEFFAKKKITKKPHHRQGPKHSFAKGSQSLKVFI